MPFSKAALVCSPGPCISIPLSFGPQLLAYMSILPSLCVKASATLASDNNVGI